MIHETNRATLPTLSLTSDFFVEMQWSNKDGYIQIFCKFVFIDFVDYIYQSSNSVFLQCFYHLNGNSVWSSLYFDNYLPVRVGKIRQVWISHILCPSIQNINILNQHLLLKYTPSLTFCQSSHLSSDLLCLLPEIVFQFLHTFDSGTSL